jgi:uncharacterized protein YyaL (SSP411 family)
MKEAIAAFTFVKYQVGDKGRLHHSKCTGKANHPGVLNDYAHMPRAALSLYESTMENQYLERAIQ